MINQITNGNTSAHNEKKEKLGCVDNPKDKFESVIELKSRERRLDCCADSVDNYDKEPEEVTVIYHNGNFFDKYLDIREDRTIDDNQDEISNRQSLFTESSGLQSSTAIAGDAVNAKSFDELADHFSKIMDEVRFKNTDTWRFSYIDPTFNDINLAVSKSQSGDLTLTVNLPSMSLRNSNNIFTNLNNRLIQKGWKTNVEYCTDMKTINSILMIK